MAATVSTMLPLGTIAPSFRLPDVRGQIVSLSDFDGAQALLVVFMCNHCPFVKHILDAFVKLAEEYKRKGVSIVAINSNDVEAYPDDRPERMANLATEKAFSFPYLYDESQDVAKAYHAACTPDFFLFDSAHKLVYRGQMDDSRPGNDRPTDGADLRAAMDAVLAGRPTAKAQKPSMGCSIKWKPGKEPETTR